MTNGLPVWSGPWYPPQTRPRASYVTTHPRRDAKTLRRTGDSTLNRPIGLQNTYKPIVFLMSLIQAIIQPARLRRLLRNLSETNRVNAIQASWALAPELFFLLRSRPSGPRGGAIPGLFSSSPLLTPGRFAANLSMGWHCGCRAQENAGPLPRRIAPQCAARRGA